MFFSPPPHHKVQAIAAAGSVSEPPPQPRAVGAYSPHKGDTQKGDISHTQEGAPTAAEYHASYAQAALADPLWFERVTFGPLIRATLGATLPAPTGEHRRVFQLRADGEWWWLSLSPEDAQRLCAALQTDAWGQASADQDPKSAGTGNCAENACQGLPGAAAQAASAAGSSIGSDWLPRQVRTYSPGEIMPITSGSDDVRHDHIGRQDGCLPMGDSGDSTPPAMLPDGARGAE